MCGVFKKTAVVDAASAAPRSNTRTGEIYEEPITTAPTAKRPAHATATDFEGNGTDLLRLSPPIVREVYHALLYCVGVSCCEITVTTNMEGFGAEMSVVEPR